MMPSLDKRDYFLRAMNAHCYRYKAWVIEAFADVHGLSSKGKPYPYALTRHPDHSYSFHDPDTNLETVLEGTFKDHGPFHFLEQLIVGAHELPNIDQNTITFYGNILVNCTCLVYAFGGKVPFQSGRMTVAKMEAVIEKRLTDKPLDEAPAGSISIDEFKKFNEGIRHLEGFSQLCVPSASKKTMTVSPEVIKRRDELVKQYAGQLNDPVVQAHIDRELIQMERDWLKGDPGERFYIKSKSYDIVRKRLFLTLGSESGFGKTGEYITKSLSEGWDIKNLPSMVNSLRSGSFSRGAETALGGVDAKNNYRIFQNTTVTQDDCGTKLGLRAVITPAMSKHFISSSVIEKDGSLTELTEANVLGYCDRPITLRSVAYCITPDQNICAVCVGKKIASTPNAISTYASDLGSAFVLLFLAKTHGVALKTSKVKFRSMLR